MKYCEVCNNFTVEDATLCATCQNEIRLMIGRQQNPEFPAPIKIKTGYGVPTAIEVDGEIKCIVCGNMSERPTLFCLECRKVIMAFSRAIGPWSKDDIARIVNGLGNVPEETWEVFKMMSEIGLRDLILSQLEEMHGD